MVSWNRCPLISYRSMCHSAIVLPLSRLETVAPGRDSSGGITSVYRSSEGGTEDQPGMVSSPGWMKYAERSAYSVMATSCIPARKLTISLKHRQLSPVNYGRLHEVRKQSGRGRARRCLTELNARASGHIQPVGRATFLEEHLDVPVAVDQSLGSIG